MTDKTRNVYWCCPATWGENSGWILLREPVTAIGSTQWTYRPPGEPEKVACRKHGERRWKKWNPGMGAVTLNYRREEVSEQEAVAIVLMTKL